MSIHRKAIIAVLLAAIALAAVVPGIAEAAPVTAQASAPHNAAFARWSDDFAADLVRIDPVEASISQYFSGAEQAALDRQLTPFTQAQRDKRLALARKGVARLDKWLAGPLDATQRISAATMKWSLANAIANAKYADHSFVFNQMSGPQVSLVRVMTQLHPIRSAADVDSYLARLDQLAQRMDEATARARSAAARSLIAPRFILERAQAQVDAVLKTPAAQNALVTSLAQRSAALPDLTPEARSAAIARATAIVDGKVIPAYARVASFMAGIHPRTSDKAGVSNLPGGAQAYRRALASFTGTSLSPDEVHAIGLREVAKIEEAMDTHLRALGFHQGTLNARLAMLERSLQPPLDPDPRPAILARYADLVRDAEKRSEKLFNIKPRAPIVVEREPALTEASASASYMLPAADGSRPGVFKVPLPGPEFEMVTMRTLAYHEGVPGHHFQLAIQQEMTDLPKFRSKRIFGGGSVHSEGWALYAEQLAVDDNWYEGDLPGLIGSLTDKLLRARRLVVDTGLHAKGWTRQQAIDYGVIAQEVDRYVAWPGQACAYMIGMLRIIEIRDKAQAALGPRFSLPAFHDVVLRTGSVPMDVLAGEVDRWVASQQSK